LQLLDFGLFDCVLFFECVSTPISTPIQQQQQQQQQHQQQHNNNNNKRMLNTQLFKYQYSLLAFLAKNELNIKIFYKNYIFGNKNLFHGTFLPFF